MSVVANVRNMEPEGEIKLPRIDIGIAKGIKLQLKSTTKLPNLKIDNPQNTQASINPKPKDIQIRESNTQILRNSIKKQAIAHRQKSEGDDFVSEVEKKLRIVLQQQNIINIEESDDSGDFQEKISKNKQILKMRKIQREAMEKSNAHIQLQKQLKNNEEKQKVASQKKNIVLQKQKSKNQSLYQKRIKDYRQLSLENKFLLKKKQNKKQENKTNQKPHDDNDNTKSLKYPHKKISSRQTPSHKVIPPGLRDEELFDNIHNILLNPAQLREKSEKKSNNDKKTTRNKKRELEEKIRELEVKLSHQKEEDLNLIDRLRAQSITEISLQKNTIQHDKNQTIDQTTWRKIEVQNLNLKSEKTNFDQQVSRVNRYLQRNQQCIQKYVQNQKVLAHMNILKKIAQREQQKIIQN